MSKKVGKKVYEYTTRGWRQKSDGESDTTDIAVIIDNMYITLSNGESHKHQDVIFHNDKGYLEVQYITQRYELFHGPLCDDGC